MKKPKILIYDIETAPNLAYVWGKWQQDVIAYAKERELLSIAWKWVGEDKVFCTTKERARNDKALTILAAKLLSEADIVIAHNGDSFDRKIIKARMIYWGLPPLKINCSVDTKKVAKTYFQFNGNGLNDLCTFLKIGKKAKNPGFDMWLGCMKGNKKSWNYMAHYNKQDVVLLDKLYHKFLPWIENHPNIAKLLNPKKKHNPYTSESCPRCCSIKIAKAGLAARVASIKQRWKCNSCGSHWVMAFKRDSE